jgi:hypothetical protein
MPLGSWNVAGRVKRLEEQVERLLAELSCEWPRWKGWREDGLSDHSALIARLVLTATDPG